MRRIIIGPLLLLLIAGISLWTLTRGPAAQTLDEAPPTGPQVTLMPLNPEEPTDETVVDPAATTTDAAATTAAPGSTPTWADDDELVLSGEASPATREDLQDSTDATISPRDDDHARELELYEDAASEFMTAFARPDPGTDPSIWWAGVEPLMADHTAADYAFTDPQQVPFTEVTGPALSVPTPAPTHLLRQVRVPTDVGTYLIGLETDEHGIHVVDLVAEAPQR